LIFEAADSVTVMKPGTKAGVGVGVCVSVCIF
jgi:hypothetical protein